MGSGQRMIKRYGSVILLSAVVAWVVISRREIRRNLKLLGTVKLSNTNKNAKTNENVLNKDKVIRNFDTKRNSLHEKSKEKYLKSNQSCSIDYLPKGFENSDKEYEEFQISEQQIYSDTFLHPTAKTQAVFPHTIINLKPDKFIFPILIRGPNNQLIGLRESIYVAMRLNRTLVVPKFFKHRTDSQLGDGKSIHPLHRVDFETLCRFIPCVTLQQFRKACGNQADVILKLRRYSSGKISSMESSSGMRFSNNADRKNKDLNYLPKNPRKTGKNGETIFGPSEKEIKLLFETQGRCAIYAQPFYNLKIKVKPSTKTIRPHANIRSYSDADIYSEIIRRTPPPKYICNIAKEFINSLFGKNNFIAIHWRYDKKDWMKRCDKLEKDNNRRKRCEDALQIEPFDLAKAITNKLEKIKYGVAKLSNIYIAAPPDQKSFVTAVKEILNRQKLSVFHLEDLGNFMEQHYGSCIFLRRHNHDIESSIEMQICANAAVFLKSSLSSWSSNVVSYRRHNSISGTYPSEDEDVFMMANKTKNERKKLIS